MPHRSTEADETKTQKIVKFLYARQTVDAATVHRLYGFGVALETTKPAIFHYNVDDALTGGWGYPTYNESSVAGRSEDVFFYYKNFIYMWTGVGRYLVRFDTTIATVFNNSYYDATAASDYSLIQPVHHPSDDIAYFFRENVVHRLNGVTWTASVLTLPDDSVITAACAYGNYLAIACTTKGTSKYKSIVFLWDRDSSLATLTERIDFGEGKIVHLANLNNKLFAVMEHYISLSGVSNIGKGKILIKQASGQFGITVNEVIVDTNVGVMYLPQVRYVDDDKLYFATGATLNSDLRKGIWVLDSNGKITLDFIEEEVETSGSYYGIYKIGNMWWIAHDKDGTTAEKGSINRTNDEEVYTYTSIYESLIFNMGDSSLTKKLIGVEVMTELLPSAGQIVLKYRSDANLDSTTWTTIYTNTTDDSISHGAINIESSGATLPEFKEIQFRIESTGGAVITGLKFKVEIIPKGLTD